MRDFTCPNPQCGDRNRTVLARKVDPTLLVIPATARAEHDGEVFWLTCPVCGRRVWWGGEIAQRMPKAA